MGILDTLIGVPPRENAGSRTSSAFGYQRNWALLQIMELHRKGDPYAVIVEFHDDVLLLDDEQSPNKVGFFQIKTSNKNWSISNLTKIIKKKKAESNFSILGKLYHHRSNFPDLPSTLNFVTNSYYDFAENKFSVCGNELKDSDKEKLLKKIKNEFPQLDLSEIDHLYFHHSPLSAQSQESHVKGEILAFLRAIIGSVEGIQVDTWYAFLNQEVERKGGYNPANIKSVEDLARYKCVKRSELDAFLNEWKTRRATIPRWADVHTQLVASNWRAADIQAVGDAWQRFSAERVDPLNIQITKLYDQIGAVINDNPPQGESLSSDHNDVLEKLQFIATTGINLSYCKAIILWRLCETYSAVQEISSESQGEKT